MYKYHHLELIEWHDFWNNPIVCYPPPIEWFKIVILLFTPIFTLILYWLMWHVLSNWYEKSLKTCHKNWCEMGVIWVSKLALLNSKYYNYSICSYSFKRMRLFSSPLRFELHTALSLSLSSSSSSLVVKY
jgi:hypothetical protein